MRIIIIFFIIYKNEGDNLLSKKQSVIPNRAKYYNKNDKERLRDYAGDEYRNLSEEEKNKNREHGRNRHHNVLAEKIQKLKEYQKTYREANKSRKS